MKEDVRRRDTRWSLLGPATMTLLYRCANMEHLKN